MTFQTKIKLKYTVQLRKERVEGLEKTQNHSDGLEHIESGTGRLLVSTLENGELPTEMSLGGESLCNLFEPEDVLFGKLRPYLAKTWVASFSGRCTTELLVVTPEKVDAQYLKYNFLAREFLEAVSAAAYGAKMPRVDWDFIGNQKIFFIPQSTQRSIANYLDRETAHIDTLIAAKERMLALLAEKRQALIARAVTRGLDAGVGMKDSGVAWLGEVPGHWEVKRLATLFKERDKRQEPELPLLEVSISAGVVLREFSSDKIEGVASDFNIYKVARKEDVVFNKMRMWQGAVGIAPEDGLVSPVYVVAYSSDKISPEFSMLLFRTQKFSCECARHSHGIVWDRLRLYWEGFRDIIIALPPVEEQRQIVNYVKKQISRIKALQDATERTIELLRERRSALITAAVTGQVV